MRRSPFCYRSDSLGFLPRSFPLARATATPLMGAELDQAASNSAKAARILKNSSPIGSAGSWTSSLPPPCAAPLYRHVLRSGRGRQDALRSTLCGVAHRRADVGQLGASVSPGGPCPRRAFPRPHRVLQATVRGTLRQLKDELPRLIARVNINVEEHLRPHGQAVLISGPDYHRYAVLVIIDEAEGLSNNALECVRDLFSWRGVGLIVIGMPGIEKRMSRFHQLYRRAGLAHQYRPLGDDRLVFVLTCRWRELGLDLNYADFTDAHAVAAINQR